jgi:hypothetical protein
MSFYGQKPPGAGAAKVGAIVEVSFWRKLLLSAWQLWERLFDHINRVSEIQPGSLFRLNARRYRGPTLELGDGTLIRPGDLVGELHLSNRAVLKLQSGYSSRVRATIAVKKECERSLAHLAALVSAGQGIPDFQAFYAITLLHQGTRILGFETREFGNPVLRWLYMTGQLLVLVIYHPAGVHRLRQGRQGLAPKYTWMSRSKLLHDFLPDKQPDPPPAAGNS